MEGQVVEMGLTTTSLLTAEKFPVIVPNSLFSSQVSFLNYSFFDETTEILLRHPIDAKLQQEGNCVTRLLEFSMNSRIELLFLD